MKNRILDKLREFTHFIWLILLIFIAVFVTYFYDTNKKNQIYYLKKSFNNIYLKKITNSLTSELNPRYITIDYKIQKGDTYENILESINIPNTEKKIILNNIKTIKEIKSLKLNQKILFKIDRKDEVRVVEFKIEIDKKKDVIFKRYNNLAKFNTKITEKNLSKKIIFKEGVIKNSLYNTALNLNIKPNTIIEFARLYGFEVDFQRDIWKGDSFQIMYEQFENDDGSLIESGDIIFSNLNIRGSDLNLYKFEINKNETDYFDENGKSMRKTLMKTPINGARLSSSFGKRKHPILGYTKMHLGTDFAAPTGTPIMASGDGIVTRAKWCGGGGNCVKIKHNSVYQTVYAHMSKFGRGIKKGVRVKQGQIIGYVGSTGLSTGPHLHYEVIENGKKINSQKLKLPSGKTLKGNERKDFEVNKIKIDVLKSELIAGLN
ncbi:M23 family metallopeptidase [Candidatus Pelagibacter sp. RS40]|uniref:M23 family metallopeptidase n=1 Tax=Candidatus Pelagibacter sp. RS40 TaxID=1977865 RepID=UPI000A15C0B3|nr:M23 family metallopeptidase [Candidatus Pelagibacter sp. RS40]ARJ49223.1 peptidase M23 [Candidatus Pelagibacter sp. RS40]